MKPTRILTEPTTIKKNGRNHTILVTDAGTMTAGEAAQAVGLTVNTIYQRIYNARRTDWRSPYIFAPQVPKTRNWNTGESIPIRMPGQRELPPPQEPAKRDTKQIRIGTWERRHYAADKLRREQTVKNLPGMDQDYDSALRLNRMMAR